MTDMLLEIDPELMYSVLKAPHNLNKTKMIKSVYAKCIGIKDKLDFYEESNFISSLKSGFESTLNIKLKEGTFSEYELEMAKNLVSTKYSNKDWLEKYE